jgi:hypothetical protein
MKNLKTISILFLLAFFLLMPVGLMADTIPVGATVPSKINLQHSSFISNTDQVLADNSQKITLTIKVFDSNDNPLANVPVLLKSNRGVLDWIQNVTGNDSGVSYVGRQLADASIDDLSDSQGVISEGNGLDGVTGHSNTDGLVYFNVYSTVPGNATFTATGDNLVTIGVVQVDFLPLPFPANVTVNLEIPKIIAPLFGGNKTGEVTVVSPTKQAFNNEQSVNLGVKVNIPFWIVFLVFLSFVLNVVFMFLLVIFALWTKITQRKEVKEIKKDTNLLEKEAAEIEALVDKNKPRLDS